MHSKYSFIHSGPCSCTESIPEILHISLNYRMVTKSAWPHQRVKVVKCRAENLTSIWLTHDWKSCRPPLPHFSLCSVCLQDLKPSNLAVNEDCELRVGTAFLKKKTRLLLSDWRNVVGWPAAFLLSHLRSWTSAWRGTPTMRWRVMWPRGGTEPLRSCWTGCTTTWQVRTCTRGSTQTFALWLSAVLGWGRKTSGGSFKRNMAGRTWLYSYCDPKTSLSSQIEEDKYLYPLKYYV